VLRQDEVVEELRTSITYLGGSLVELVDLGITVELLCRVGRVVTSTTVD
jgi:hypothetical protein